MTREQAREAAAVMIGWADGRRIQYKLPLSKLWNDFPDGEDEASWNWDDVEFRLKPTATLRPWTADEVPLGAWLRWKNDNSSRSILSTTGDEKFRESMLKQYEHSTDGGLTWKPCGVEEEVK